MTIVITITQKAFLAFQKRRNTWYLMQIAYGSGTFKVRMNNDTRVKARGQPGHLHPPKQHRTSVHSENVALRENMSTNYSNGTALKKRQTDLLCYQWSAHNTAMRWAKRTEIQSAVSGSRLWKEVSACLELQVKEERPQWQDTAVKCCNSSTKRAVNICGEDTQYRHFGRGNAKWGS